MREELLKGLSEEQIAKIKACKDKEEILKLAKNEGIELNDEQLEAVSGGCGGASGLTCPHCGSGSYEVINLSGRIETYYCQSCGKTFYRDADKNIVSGRMIY